VSNLRRDGYEILSVPGASAVTAGLSVSGLPSKRFYFEGFLPAKSKQRRERLLELRTLDATLICYEAPHRIMDLLVDISMAMGAEREVCIARELTKKFETVRLSRIDELIAAMSKDIQQQKGEFVVMIAPVTSLDKVDEIKPEVLDMLKELAEILPPKKAAQIVSNFSGISIKQLYERILQFKC